MANITTEFPPSNLLVNPHEEKDLYAHISVDCVILGFDNESLKVLLIQHNGGPKDGEWALPGDFVHIAQSLESTPYDLLKRLTGIEDIFIRQLGAFGAIDRVDYRRIITIAYYALISPQSYVLKIGPGARDVAWFNVNDTPCLIFDHDLILQKAIDKVRVDLDHMPIGLELLPEQFTLSQLQKFYEVVLDAKLDTRNFRRKLLNSKVLIDTGKVDSSVPYRAPKLYQYNKAAYPNYSFPK